VCAHCEVMHNFQRTRPPGNTFPRRLEGLKYNTDLMSLITRAHAAEWGLLQMHVPMASPVVLTEVFPPLRSVPRSWTWSPSSRLRARQLVQRCMISSWMLPEK